MFKDLFTAIAAGVIGALPVQPAPVIVVPAASIEQSVVQYIAKNEHRTVSIDCEFDTDELSLKEDESQDYTCLTTDTENKEKFDTHIIVSVVDKKVNLTATLDKPADASKTVKPSTEKPVTSEKK